MAFLNWGLASASAWITVSPFGGTVYARDPILLLYLLVGSSILLNGGVSSDRFKVRVKTELPYKVKVNLLLAYLVSASSVQASAAVHVVCRRPGRKYLRSSIIARGPSTWDCGMDAPRVDGYSGNNKALIQSIKNVFVFSL
jgi:hypothetical protein